LFRFPEPALCAVASSTDREPGFPRQQSQSGSLPPAPVEVGRFHALGAPERRWRQRRFCIRTTSPRMVIAALRGQLSGGHVAGDLLNPLARQLRELSNRR
jgi:hypothetical protein